MLFLLLRAAGVNHAVVGLHNDVRRAGISAILGEPRLVEHRGQRGSVKHLAHADLVSVGLQKRNGLRNQRRIGQPDQRNVVFCRPDAAAVVGRFRQRDQTIVGEQRGRREAVVVLAGNRIEAVGVDWRLTVLGGDDDQRGIV